MAAGVKAIGGVSHTWFEHTPTQTGWAITLVAEVAETDPNILGFDPGIFDQIQAAASSALDSHTTMIVSHLRIVPQSR